MKIQVRKCYDGNRAKRPIEEGIYDENSRKVFGLARYLIDNGNAHEVIEPEELAIEPETEIAREIADNYQPEIVPKTLVGKRGKRGKPKGGK